jgi:SAGA-associated factor 29
LERLIYIWDHPQSVQAPTLPPPTINVATPSTPSSSTGPLPTSGTGPNGKKKKRPSMSLSPAPTPIEASPAIKKDRSATPAAAPVKARNKEPFADQLPLQPGRRVAFKVPPSSKAEGGEDEEWILVTVRKCLGDKVRYEVVDADDNKT